MVYSLDHFYSLPTLFFERLLTSRTPGAMTQLASMQIVSFLCRLSSICSGEMCIMSFASRLSRNGIISGVSFCLEEVRWLWHIRNSSEINLSEVGSAELKVILSNTISCQAQKDQPICSNSTLIDKTGICLIWDTSGDCNEREAPLKHSKYPYYKKVKTFLKNNDFI